MRWEERLVQVFDDLEQQAEGLHLAERDATVAELSVSSYAEISLAARLHASTGALVRLTLPGDTSIEGVLSQAGRDWVLVCDGPAATVVHLPAVQRVHGASSRAVPDEARCVTERLGLASVLRQLAADREPLALTLTGGATVRGTLRRVGADFVEIATESGRAELVALNALALVRR